MRKKGWHLVSIKFRRGFIEVDEEAKRTSIFFCRRRGLICVSVCLLCVKHGVGEMCRFQFNHPNKTLHILSWIIYIYSQRYRWQTLRIRVGFLNNRSPNKVTKDDGRSGTLTSHSEIQCASVRVRVYNVSRLPLNQRALCCYSRTFFFISVLQTNIIFIK